MASAIGAANSGPAGPNTLALRLWRLTGYSFFTMILAVFPMGGAYTIWDNPELDAAFLMVALLAVLVTSVTFVAAFLASFRS